MESIKARALKIKALLSPAVVEQRNVHKQGLHYKNSATGSEREIYPVLTNPADWDAFCCRVLSFCQPNMTLAWLLKPIELSPLNCAKFGWKLIQKDVIQCTTCKKMISGKLPDPKNGLNVYRERVTEVIRSLETGHLSCCPWPSNPSADSFLSLCHEPVDANIKSLISRITSMTTSDILPMVDEDFMPETMKYSGQCILLRLKPEFSWNVFVLAITGWSQVSSPENSDKYRYLECDRCFRKVGIWNYKSNAMQENPTTESSSVPNNSTIEETKYNPEESKNGKETEQLHSSPTNGASVDELSDKTQNLDNIHSTNEGEKSVEEVDIGGSKDCVTEGLNSTRTSNSEGGSEMELENSKIINNNTDEDLFKDQKMLDKSTDKDCDMTPPEESGTADQVTAIKRPAPDGDMDINHTVKKIKLLEAFNPVHEHRTWCPWIRPCLLKPDDLYFEAGWNAVFHQLSTTEQNPSCQIKSPKYNDRWSGLKTIRSLIQQWKSNG